MSHYKVLRNIGGVLKSYLIHLDLTKFSLIYKPGEITEPKIGNPTINHRILDHNDVSESNVVNFWNNTYNISKRAPLNTVFCDYVKLLRRIR